MARALQFEERAGEFVVSIRRCRGARSTLYRPVQIDDVFSRAKMLNKKRKFQKVVIDASSSKMSIYSDRN